MVFIHGRWDGAGLLLVVLAIGTPGRGDHPGQQAKERQRDLDATTRDHPLNSASPRYVESWCAVGNHGAKSLARGWGSPIEEPLAWSSRFLALVKDDAQKSVKPDERPLTERLPAKIQKIHRDLPAWIHKTGKMEEAKAAMQKLDRQLKDEDFEEAEKTADAVLRMLGDGTQAADGGIPEEARRMLRHELGGAFLVTRDKVQAKLKLTKEQKARVDQCLKDFLPDAVELFQKLEGLKEEARAQAFQPFRMKSRAKLTALLKDILNDGQRTRLRQLELQREGLRDGEIWKELHVTDEQRKQFIKLIQGAQQKIRPLIEEAQAKGNPKEIQPKVIKIRDELEESLEGILSGDQKTQWKAMRGKPIEMAALFDLAT